MSLLQPAACFTHTKNLCLIRLEALSKPPSRFEATLFACPVSEPSAQGLKTMRLII
ncbi:hypothetical protein MPNT_430012 [Candidatus Methylacidithermus pantelleriae]|uniref:Uncharacterized protein n=1 Tax=Candidatus Methylacidithermus pantelleriae TaxID=2744239 RepID=A0A8J2FT49_9BACT|nr:hypothetical protein MPNT_430012 [Candidatus Methylacidithermus pantelleriae]